MRLSTYPILFAFCGLASVRGDGEITFEDVRDKLPKTYSGQGGEPGPKYFKESSYVGS
jgi:hypothetical protein